MRKNKITAFVATLLLLIVWMGAGVAKAATPVVLVSPQPTWLSPLKPYDKHPSARSVENGYYLALMERQIDVDRQADYRHIIREIVSEAGIQNGSEISVSFDPSYEKLEFHQITVWRNNKPQNRLKPGDFKLLADEEDFSKFIYQGSYSANYIIPDIRKGDRIEYAYTVTGRNPVFNGKFCQNIYMQGSQFIAHQFVSLQASAQHKLNLKSFNKVPAANQTVVNGVKRYTWEDFQVPSTWDENSFPGWYTSYGYVEISEFSSWGEVIDWAMKVNPVSTNIKGQLGEHIAKLKAEAGNDKEKYFRAAVKTVQDEVRYMGIEIGEYSHRANHPENVFNQRYGDCKDKALLLASMLRADGIEANMVLVNTQVQDKIDQLLPTSNAFNHAVVVANLNGKQLWVDATIAYQRGRGVNLYFPDYGKGLVLKAGNTGLTSIPLSQTGQVVCKEKYTIKGIGKKVRLDVTTTYTLNQANDVRSRLAETGIYTSEKNYLKYYTKLYPKIESRDSLQIKDDEDKNELTTIESYLITDFFKKDSTSGKYDAGFYANYIDNELPTISNKNAPVSLDYPYATDYTIEVNMPEPWDMRSRSYAIKRDAYSFESDYGATDTKLTLHYKFAFLKDYLAADQVEQARKDFAEMKDSKLSYNFYYNPGVGDSSNNSSNAGQGVKFLPLNYWMISYNILIALVCLGLAIWVYYIETPAIVFEPGASFIPIGGWLILIIIGLFATPVNIIGILYQSNYYNISTWNLYLHKPDNTIFRLLIIWEVFGNSVLFCYAIFCLVLLFNKRDILPMAITGYFAFGAVFFAIDYLMALNFKSEAVRASALYPMLRSLVVAAIWIPYFKRSIRVQQTFIVPYPHHNFSYEKPGQPVE